MVTDKPVWPRNCAGPVGANVNLACVRTAAGRYSSTAFAEELLSSSPERVLLDRQPLAFPRRARTLGRNPLPGCSLGDTTCSTLVMVTLTASSITTIPDTPEQQSAYYGLVNLTVQRMDGGSAEFTWRLPAPTASGGVTSQILLYAVPVYSAQDVVYVSASNANGYVSDSFSLKLSFFVRTALPSTGAGPGAAAPGDSDSSGGASTRAGLIAGCVLGGVAALVLLALAAWGLTSRLRRRNALSYLDAEGGRKGRRGLGASGCLVPFRQDSSSRNNSSTCGSRAEPAGGNGLEESSCTAAVCDTGGAVTAAVADTAAVPRAAAPVAPIGARGATRQVRDIPPALKRGPRDAGVPQNADGAAGGSGQSARGVSVVRIQVSQALEGRGCGAPGSWPGCLPWLLKPKRAVQRVAGTSDGAGQLQRQAQAQQALELQLQVSAEHGGATPQDGSNEQCASECSGASRMRCMAELSVPRGATVPPAVADDQQEAICTAVGQEGSGRHCVPAADGQEPGTADRGPYLSAFRLMDQAAPGCLAAEANAASAAGAFECEEPTLGVMCEQGLVSTGDGSEGCLGTVSSQLVCIAVANCPVAGTARPDGPRPLSGGSPRDAARCPRSSVGRLTSALSSAGEASACAAPGPDSILTGTSGPPTSTLPFLEGPDDGEGTSGSARGTGGHASACSRSGSCTAAVAMVQGAALREVPTAQQAQQPRLAAEPSLPQQQQQQLVLQPEEGVAGEAPVPALDSAACRGAEDFPSPDSTRLAHHTGSAYFSATGGWSVSSGALPMLEDVSGFAKESIDDSWEGPRPPDMHPLSCCTEAAVPVGSRPLLPAAAAAHNSTAAPTCGGGGAVGPVLIGADTLVSAAAPCNPSAWTAAPAGPQAASSPGPAPVRASLLPAPPQSDAAHAVNAHTTPPSPPGFATPTTWAPAASVHAADSRMGAHPSHAAHEQRPAALLPPGQQQATGTRHPPPSPTIHAGDVAGALAPQPTCVMLATLQEQRVSCTPPAPGTGPGVAAQGTQLTLQCCAAPPPGTALTPSAAGGALQAAGGLHMGASAVGAMHGGGRLLSTDGRSGSTTACGTSTATTTSTYQHHAHLHHHQSHALTSNQASAMGSSSTSVGAAWRLSHGSLMAGMAGQLAATGAAAVGLGGPNARAAQEQEQEGANPLLKVRNMADGACERAFGAAHREHRRCATWYAQQTPACSLPPCGFGIDMKASTNWMATLVWTGPRVPRRWWWATCLPTATWIWPSRPGTCSCTR